MSLIYSFNNSHELQLQLIQKINHYRDEKWLNPFVNSAWMPEHCVCTPVGAMLEDAKVEKFTEITGLPYSLGILHQGLISSCVVGISSGANRMHPDALEYILPESLSEAWTMWLQLITPGSTIPDLFPRVMASILHGCLASDHVAAAMSDQLRHQVLAVADLFSEEADGKSVSNARWTEARNISTAMTDALADNDSPDEPTTIMKAVAKFLESICWPWNGDYAEPLAAVQTLAQELAEVLIDRLCTEQQKEIKAGARRAMLQFWEEAGKNPNFNPEVFFANSPEIKMANSVEFQNILRTYNLAVIPQVGGRMMQGFLDCILKYQVK